MRSIIVCPECQTKLALHRPAIASTRVKCRHCKAKFYAGAAGPVAAAPPPPAVPASEGAEPAVAEQPAAAAVADRPTRHRKRAAAPATTWPKWLVPLGLGLLVCVASAGMFFTPKVQLPADVPPEPVAATPAAKPKPVLPADGDPRPSLLIGTWELQEPGGGVVELSADGTARVNAPLVTDQRLDFTVRWFVVEASGDTYTLELGQERGGFANHQARFVIGAGNVLRLKSYRTNAEVSVRVREFKLKKTD